MVKFFRMIRRIQNPELSSAAAFQKAVKSVGAEKYMWEDAAYIAENNYKKPTVELVYIPVKMLENTA